MKSTCYLFITLTLFIFSSCGTENAPTFKLSTSVVPAEAGTVSPSDGEFSAGETVTIAAVPNDNWSFREWSGDESGSSDEITISFNSNKEIIAIFRESNVIEDVDGNIYTVISIGDQHWMAENLRVKNYRDGSPIDSNLNDLEWSSANHGAFAIYPYESVEGINSEQEMSENYGILYNWFALTDERGLCPDGWRAPDNHDWQTLVQIMGDDPASKLKSDRTEPAPHPRWRKGSETDSGHVTYTNESGFSALPTGIRRAEGSYNEDYGYRLALWSLTETDIRNNEKIRGNQENHLRYNYSEDDDKEFANMWRMSSFSNEVDMASDTKNWGAGVRCIKK